MSSGLFQRAAAGATLIFTWKENSRTDAQVGCTAEGVRTGRGPTQHCTSVVCPMPVPLPAPPSVMEDINHTWGRGRCSVVCAHDTMKCGQLKALCPDSIPTPLALIKSFLYISFHLKLRDSVLSKAHVSEPKMIPKARKRK